MVGTGAGIPAIAAGVARFLAVESCGQCTPCKQDGLARADALEPLCAAGAVSVDLDADRAGKQPDWTHDADWAGSSPLDRHTDDRAAAG